MPVPVTCLNCSKTFKTSPSRARQFCSKSCYREYQRIHHTTEVTCVICGKTFPQQISRAKEQVTCRSEECIQALQKMSERKPNYGQRKYTFMCPGCEKSFKTINKRQKYCSESCRYAYTHAQKACVICGNLFECKKGDAQRLVTCRSKECKRAIKLGEHNYFYGKHHTDEAKKKVSKAKRKEYINVECACGCGETFELPLFRIRNSKTNLFFVDPTHMRRWLVGENHWNYRGGGIYYGEGWEKASRAVRARDKVCQHCGKTPEENGRALDVHHKIPARVNRDNSMDNLIALCKSCHHKATTEERYAWPMKVPKTRKCIVCNQVFTPLPFQRICSDECRRKRTRQWEKKHRDTHPTYNHNRRQRIKQWQQKNKHRVNASHQRTRLRKKIQPQAGPGLFD